MMEIPNFLRRKPPGVMDKYDPLDTKNPPCVTRRTLLLPNGRVIEKELEDAADATVLNTPNPLCEDDDEYQAPE